MGRCAPWGQLTPTLGSRGLLQEPRSLCRGPVAGRGGSGGSCGGRLGREEALKGLEGQRQGECVRSAFETPRHPRPDFRPALDTPGRIPGPPGGRALRGLEEDSKVGR